MTAAELRTIVETLRLRIQATPIESEYDKYFNILVSKREKFRMLWAKSVRISGKN